MSKYEFQISNHQHNQKLKFYTKIIHLTKNDTHDTMRYHKHMTS